MDEPCALSEATLSTPHAPTPSLHHPTTAPNPPLEDILFQRLGDHERRGTRLDGRVLLEQALVGRFRGHRTEGLRGWGLGVGG